MKDFGIQGKNIVVYYLLKFLIAQSLLLAGFIIGSLVKVWPWSNMEAIVCSQFPEVALLAETAEASGTETALAALDAAVVANAPMTDPHIPGAVIFALIGFCLVTGIEIAGKMITEKNQA